MINLQRVVDKVRDDLKKTYLKNPSAVWQKTTVIMIRKDDCDIMDGAGMTDPGKVVKALQHFVSTTEVKGIVVGRMVAKFSKTVRDVDGNPAVMSRAILVSGRLLDSEQTYISITPSREHNDLRELKEGQDEPVSKLPDLARMDSPHAVKEIRTDGGHLKGFKSIRFDKEKVFDSRRGDKCVLDPIIEGVLKGADGERYER